jgi:tRNA modification GTPase
MVVERDTIAAIATALGEAGIGIVRVSGPEARDVARKVFRSPSGKRPVLGDSRVVRYGCVSDPQTGESIDEGLLLWMPKPRSYTAEDVAELQVHGGIRVLERVLDAVLRAGARLAEPGEFTKRAFLNGRIDLAQAEAVIDLIRAKTDLATKSALRQVRGALGNWVRDLRRRLLGLQALVEVTIDYPEHDVESEACAEVAATGEQLLAELDQMLSSARMGQILREGVATAIVGRPNVGKSSLLNALLRRDRAIVTDVPGTTRDVLEEYANVRGIPFKLVDTAGIRETEDVVERIGVERSREMLAAAELVLVVLNGAEPLVEDDVQLLRDTAGQPRIVVVNKADLPQQWPDEELAPYVGTDPVIRMSAKRPQDLPLLEEAMTAAVLGGQTAPSEVSYMTNARQARLIEQARADIAQAVEAARHGVTLDVIAVALQSAYAALGLIIGEEVGEDLLDEIFSRFCLGK